MRLARECKQCVRPGAGVMAQTGMECLEIIKGVVSEVKPDFVVTLMRLRHAVQRGWAVPYS